MGWERKSGRKYQHRDCFNRRKEQRNKIYLTLLRYIKSEGKKSYYCWQIVVVQFARDLEGVFYYCLSFSLLIWASAYLGNSQSRKKKEEEVTQCK